MEPVVDIKEAEEGVKRKVASYYVKPKEAEKKRKLAEALNKPIRYATKVYVQFVSTDGEVTGSQLELPLGTDVKQLKKVLNALLQNEEPLPYSFFLEEAEITQTLDDTVTAQKASTEKTLTVRYQPQALFRVKSVTRCTSSLPGHTEAVLSVHFSPNGRQLASGSGDCTVRMWDILTETPLKTCVGHKNWVLAVAWSPTGDILASGGMDGLVILWDGKTGKKLGKPMAAHKKWITSLAWEPYIASQKSKRLVSGSKDGTIKMWDVTRKQLLLSFSSHTAAIKDVKWGGQGLIYSASQDRTIKVWEAKTGRCLRSLKGHAHWVNNLSLNTDYALRIGPYDHKGNCADTPEGMLKAAQDKYDKVYAAGGNRELLVSCSDDFTGFLWDPVNTDKPIVRLIGHQQPINYIAFSPDGRVIATGGFDKAVKLWNGLTGKFMASLRGHVQSVYQLAWSADSRLLVSASKDSTMKVWNIQKRTMDTELPGHADEVFAADWSPDGIKVVSGGKDCILKIWRR